MKPLRVRSVTPAFSLIELLVVIAVIAVLASVLLPVIAQAPVRARQTKCLNNLRQIGISFQLFAHDHDSRFPMRVSALGGGSREFVNTPQTFRHFQALSNQLDNPRILACPGDTRAPAFTWAELRNRNLSYFVGLQASPDRPMSVLGGDRNVSRLPAKGGGGVVINATANWTGEQHRFRGNLLLSDGSTHRTTDGQLQTFLTGAARVSQ